MLSVALPLGAHIWSVPALFAAGPLEHRSSAPSARGVSKGARTAAEQRLFIIEDNAADVDLVREALGALPFKVDVSAAHDGEQALAVLRGEAQHGRLPDVVFLDLNLPRMSGHEVLAQLKTDPALRDVPVVVLTSSSAAKDSDASSALRADEFVTKPVDVDEYFRTVQATARRWLELPDPAQGGPRG